jgi:hypothetical protein
MTWNRGAENSVEENSVEVALAGAGIVAMIPVPIVQMEVLHAAQVAEVVVEVVINISIRNLKQTER